VRAVRTGIVGAGFMNRMHARLLTELSNGEVAGVVYTRPDVAAQVAEEIGARAYPSVESLLEDAGDLDAVVVATPEPDHRSAVEAAAAGGCAVFVEKPIASNLALAVCLAAEASLENDGAEVSLSEIDEQTKEFERSEGKHHR
jgi:myo-inositol 2-dehydrogenase/D-chiro-inositol 1-dehydrogenase